MKYAAMALAATLLLAQRPAQYPIWEVKTLLPQERSPARYTQVQQYDVDRMAAEGWELVAVTPYVYLNEERGQEGHKLMVTQTYQAYYFKRLKPQR
jgi:hypothetical protein